MKKITYIIVIFFCIVLLFFVNSKSLSKSKKFNIMSQTEQNYFVYCGQRYDAEFFSGTREDNFLYDGFSNNKLFYGIIKITFTINQTYAQSIKCMFCVNDDICEYILAKNPFENCFMCDIQKNIKNNDNLQIFVDGFDEKFNNLTCVSNEWKINYNKALDISFDIFSNYIKNNSKSGKSCECYLKIGIADYTEQKKFFWSFFVKPNNTEYKCLVIDVISGEILSKN